MKIDYYDKFSDEKKTATATGNALYDTVKDFVYRKKRQRYYYRCSLCVRMMNCLIEREVDSMDKLTEMKKLKLISDCIAAENSIGKRHIDIRKMFAYLVEQAVKAETSSDIKDLEIAKVLLDFLVRGIVK